MKDIEKIINLNRLFPTVELREIETGLKTSYRWSWYIVDLNTYLVCCEDETPLGYLTYPEAFEASMKATQNYINIRYIEN